MALRHGQQTEPPPLLSRLVLGPEPDIRRCTFLGGAVALGAAMHSLGVRAHAAVSPAARGNFVIRNAYVMRYRRPQRVSIGLL